MQGLCLQIEAKPGDVPNAMRVFNQAPAGAYAVGACLNSPLLGNAAVASTSGMLVDAMEAAATMVGAGLAAAAAAAKAMEQSGQLDSAAAATLRTRLPFLVGLLLRGLSDAPFPEHSPGGRALAEVRRVMWTPGHLHKSALLSMHAMARLLGQSAGEQLRRARSRCGACLWCCSRWMYSWQQALPWVAC